MDPDNAEPPADRRSRIEGDDRRRGNWARSSTSARARSPATPTVAPGRRPRQRRLGRRRARRSGRRSPAGPADPGLHVEDGGEGAGARDEIGGVDVPGTYEDRAFTIAAGQAQPLGDDHRVVGRRTNDWDLVVFRHPGQDARRARLVRAGPAQPTQRAGRPRPPAAGRLRDPRTQLRRRRDLHGAGAVRRPRRRVTPSPAAVRRTSRTAATATRSTRPVRERDRDQRRADGRRAARRPPTTGTSPPPPGCRSATSPRSRWTRRRAFVYVTLAGYSAAG